MLFAVTTPQTGTYGGYIRIRPDSFPWLKTVSSSFERVIWDSLHVYWRPAVGTNADGLVTYGVDWEYDKTPATSRDRVQTLTPVHDTAVWQETSSRPLVLPVKRLKGRLEYAIQSDDFPGWIVLNVTGLASKFVGELWAVYTVTLAGTRTA